MAYDSSILKEQEEDQGMNVLGQQVPTQQQGQQPPAGQQQPQTGQRQSSTIQAGSPGARPASAGKPRSGLATNITQYMQANQGQATKLAESTGKALTKDISKIAEQTQKKQDAYRANLQRIRDDQLRPAQTNFQNVIQQAANTGNVNDQQAMQFRQFVEADNPLTQGIQEFRVPEAEVGLQDLRQSVDAASTAEGRKNLLRKAFAEQGREYTRGQQALDNLFLQTTEAGREGLQQTLAQQEQQAANVIDTGRRQAVEQLSNLRAVEDAARADLQNMLASSQQRVAGETNEQFERRRNDIIREAQRLNELDQQRKQQIKALRGLVESDLTFDPVMRTTTFSPGSFTLGYGTKRRHGYRDIDYDFNVNPFSQDIAQTLGTDRITRDQFERALSEVTGNNIRLNPIYDPETGIVSSGGSDSSVAGRNLQEFYAAPSEEVLNNALINRGEFGLDRMMAKSFQENPLNQDFIDAVYGDIPREGATSYIQQGIDQQLQNIGSFFGTGLSRNQKAQVLQALDEQSQRSQAQQFLSDLGIDARLSDIINPSRNQDILTRSALLGPDEISRYNALQQLAGSSRRINPNQSLITPATFRDAINRAQASDLRNIFNPQPKQFVS